MTIVVTEQTLIDAYTRHKAATLAADTTELSTLLRDDFTLTHMTGYVQPKTEWLSDIATGQMAYHDTLDIEVRADAETQTVRAKSKTTATIWGTTGTWNLQLIISFEEVGNELVATHTQASSWR